MDDETYLGNVDACHSLNDLWQLGHDVEHLARQLGGPHIALA